MCAMWPTTSAKRHAYVKYCVHIAIMTGKEGEVMSLEGIDTISDLISKLDKQYPGLNTAIFIQKGGRNGKGQSGA